MKVLLSKYDFFYHITYSSNIQSISEFGLNTIHARNFYGEHETYKNLEDSLGTKPIFFCTLNKVYEVMQMKVCRTREPESTFRLYKNEGNRI